MQDLILKLITDAKTRLAVLLLLLMLLAYQVSITIWYFVPQPEIARDFIAMPSSSGAPQQANKLTVLQKVQIISRANLFGIKTSDAPIVTKEEAPETKLNYKLRGIFYSTNDNLSSIILEKSRNDVKHYLIDSELEKGVSLAAIKVDHILINRYGKLEKLMLEKEETALVKNDANNSNLGSMGRGSAAATAVLKTYKRKFSNNPMALAKKFQAVPVTKNGKSVGFKLKALRGETLLKKLKFQAGDVFTAINGIGLDKPFQALDALKSLTTSNSATVTFIRNGNQQTIDFKL